MTGMRISYAQRFVICVVAVAVCWAPWRTVEAHQDRYAHVELTDLGSFPYNAPAPADVKAKKHKPAAIPERIKGLNGRPVSVSGFMVPYEIGAILVTEFLLTISADSCTFGGQVTNANEWILVTIRPGGGAQFSHDVVNVRGILEVGEQFDPYGNLTSLYRMSADYVFTSPLAASTPSTDCSSVVRDH